MYNFNNEQIYCKVNAHLYVTSTVRDYGKSSQSEPTDEYGRHDIIQYIFFVCLKTVTPYSNFKPFSFLSMTV